MVKTRSLTFGIFSSRLEVPKIGSKPDARASWGSTHNRSKNEENDSSTLVHGSVTRKNDIRVWTKEWKRGKTWLYLMILHKGETVAWTWRCVMDDGLGVYFSES